MTTTVSKLYELQVTGTNAGTWGDVLNDDVFTIIDANLGVSTSLSLVSTNVSLNATQAQSGMLVFTGALLGNVQVTSANIGVYWVENRTSGNFYVSLTNGTGNPMLVPQGAGRQVWADATYGVRALNLPPPGSFLDLGSSTPHPSLLATTALVGEYLVCDGSSFLTTGVTANLYQAIGTQWGAGPLLPDLRGRARFGKDLGAGRITSAGSGIDGSTVASAGGAQTVTINQVNLPNVNFTVSDPGHAHPALYSMPVTSGLVNIGAGTGFGGTASVSPPSLITGAAVTSISVNSGGSGAALNKMPPTAIVNVLIKI